MGLTAELSAARARLLPESTEREQDDELPETSPAADSTAPDGQELARFDRRWLLYAPFNLVRLAFYGAAFGLITQYSSWIPAGIRESAARVWERFEALPLAVMIAVALLVAVVSWLAESVLGYLLRWGNLRVLRTSDSLRVQSGLTTVRTTTIESARIRGVDFDQPAVAQLLGGAELTVLATGVEDGTVAVLPVSPVALNRAVAADILGSSTPLDMELQGHGPKARRRSHVRHQMLTLFLAGAAAVVTLAFDWPMWWWALVGAYALLAVLRAELSWRRLGHGLTPVHLISRSGAFSVTTTVMQTDGIIGWDIHQTYFQRRLGLANLVASVAAGTEYVTVSDVPIERAWAIAHAASPRVLHDFLA